MHRRQFLKYSTALAAACSPLFAPLAAAAQLKALGDKKPFDYAWLKGRARSLAAADYLAPSKITDASLKALDFDTYNAIHFKPDHGLWADESRLFQVRFFHPGYLFESPVQMYEVVDGQAQQLAYDPAMFDYGKSGVDGRKLPRDLGFAGFKLLFHTDPQRDLAAFLGASYFRAVGGEMQFGLSARALAVDTGLPRAEEFPQFTHFWFERPARDSGQLTVHALMDSPSVAGAYRFVIAPGAVQVMDVDAALYPRKAIERLGVAPLTSMYQTGENDRRKAYDWRPEIHDSDGLAMLSGSGEWIWRPLLNPEHLRFNSYADQSPRGFGLMQRDRNFENYQDDGVFYERRPSLWVEPKGDWGKGAVQLMELPTEDETFDNIVAFWNPAEPARPGEERLFSYRLHWGAHAPVEPAAARVIATRTGLGGVVGQPRKYFSWRFAIDFAGGDLPMLGRDVKVEPVIDSSGGEIELASARPLHAVNGYRVMFDLKPKAGSREPINLRVFLRADGRALSETWLYQWSPPGG
ncbi:MAG: glucan biosynthesis protein D [Rhodocyclaceae bacterium]|nr:glucan biosynthesis protein D [Rhodocyclaceae bacterium]MCB1911976.1 glucan biosynthesis protein D [Rhodocyclaceae bacterium]MCP5241510.1 glucan biosynthesis protein D [Zoogloeaceae bacterium]MCP5256055.1 glucan biosynthesis protein D [Zoogloeaceae bacterium]MCW5615917.1 glucan biosynthesis protein D [Rhodocyclaceae bacterium]